MSKNERATAGKVAAKLKEIGSRPAGKLAEGASILSYIRAVDAHGFMVEENIDPKSVHWESYVPPTALVRGEA